MPVEKKPLRNIVEYWRIEFVQLTGQLLLKYRDGRSAEQWSICYNQQGGSRFLSWSHKILPTLQNLVQNIVVKLFGLKMWDSKDYKDLSNLKALQSTSCSVTVSYKVRDLYFILHSFRSCPWNNIHTCSWRWRKDHCSVLVEAAYYWSGWFQNSQLWKLADGKYSATNFENLRRI